MQVCRHGNDGCSNTILGVHKMKDKTFKMVIKIRSLNFYHAKRIF